MRVPGLLFSRLLLLGCLATACAPIRFTSQDVILKQDQKHDVLDVLILYNDIENGEDTSRPNAESETDWFVSKVISGKREFMLFDWPFQVDLDELSQVHDQSPLWGDWRREGVELLRGISVERSGFFRSEKGRPSLFQHFRIRNASHLIALLDQSLRLSIQESIELGTFEKSTPWLDKRTRELLTNLVMKKNRWLTLQDGVLTAEFPMTSQSAARVFAEVMRDSGSHKEDGRILNCLAARISEVSVAGDSTRLSWGTKDSPMKFHFETEGPYDSSLAESIIQSGHLPKDVPSKDEVFASFEGR